MREIKFRVWDKDYKKMRVCGTDSHDTISFTTDGKAYYYNLQNGEGSLTDDSSYALMQYTGLKDKNGVEIYEGDIVTWQVNNGTWTAPIYYDLYQASFWMGEDINGNGGLVLNDWLRGEYEVIGNIHDNPELLGEGTE